MTQQEAEKPNEIAVQLLAKFPEFNPRWPDEVQTRWFETFDKLLATFTQPTNQIIHGDKLI